MKIFNFLSEMSRKILKYPDKAMAGALFAVRDGMPTSKTNLLEKYRGENPEERKMCPKTKFSKISLNLNFLCQVFPNWLLNRRWIF